MKRVVALSKSSPFPHATGATRRSLRILSTAAFAALLTLVPAGRGHADDAASPPAATATAPDRAALDCVADKTRAALKQTAAVFTGLRHALATGTEPDLGCINLAARQLATTFAMLEAKGTYSITGEAIDVARTVDEFALRTVQALLTDQCRAPGEPCDSVFVPCCPGLSSVQFIGQPTICR